MTFIYYTACIFLNASIFSFLFYFLLKYFTKNGPFRNNQQFYHDIVNSKIVYIINESNDINNGEVVKNVFQVKSEKYIEAGFDCEWAPGKNVSLIQIAFPDGTCFLIRLKNNNNDVPNEILAWLEDSSKLKFGIGILEDGKKLESQWSINLRGCVDLRHLAVRVKPNGLDKMGLKSFALNWLGLDYENEVEPYNMLSAQCSDWSQEKLSVEQIEYASLDGLVGGLCPVEFLCRKLNMDPVDALENLNLVRSYCQGCIDLRYKSKKTKENAKAISIKSNRKLFCYKRSSPIYDNTILLTPDGEMLSRLSKKKADWYLKKELAVKVSDDPFVVKLKFEPTSRASGQNDYYIQEKENVCVVCGYKDGCVRKNIIPIEYRRHYPVSHKSHKSHDVLPLCVNCHRLSNVIDDRKKKELAIQFDAPLGSRDSVLNKVDFNRSRIRNAAKALLYQDKIPEERVSELKEIVAEYYNIDLSPDDGQSISTDVLMEAVNMEIAVKDGKFVSHGLKVVSTLQTSASLVNFEVMWREHFVKEMQPKFLPVGWEIYHRVERYSAIKME